MFKQTNSQNVWVKIMITDKIEVTKIHIPHKNNEVTKIHISHKNTKNILHLSYKGNIRFYVSLKKLL